MHWIALALAAGLGGLVLAGYAAAQENLTFIDTTDAFLGRDVTPDRRLFQLDRLHPGKKGYAVWTSIIKPVLMEDLGYVEERV